MDKESVGILFSPQKEMLSFVTVWMNLDDIILSEISQAQKYKYYMLCLRCFYALDRTLLPKLVHSVPEVLC